MVSIPELWAPILLSAILAFVASSLSHMVLKLHKSDYTSLPDEGKVLDALRGLAPGAYPFPHCADMKDMGSPAMIEKYKRGPVGFVTVIPSGPPNMGKSLSKWFGYCVLVAIFAAYVAGRTLEPGTAYLQVFRVAGTVAFVGFGLGNLVDSIWKGQRFATTLRFVVDGLVYALLTGGSFGWLWPAA
jgi:hypothetical protein